MLANERRRNDALKELGNNGEVDFFIADLSDQENVQDVIKKIKDKWESIDILINNAGVLFNELRMSKQDNEMHYEVNTLAPYMLTIGLKEMLLKSQNPIVVNTVTQGIQKLTLNVTELIKPTKFKEIMGGEFSSYMQSKNALLLLMNTLSKDWKGVRIVNVHPGGNRTKMTTGDGMPFWLKLMVPLIGTAPIKGAKLIYNAAFDEKHKNKTGIYLQENKITEMKSELSEVQENKLLAGVRTAHNIR